MADGFDASRYLTKVSGRDYLEVKWRLVWLRSVHPDAAIVTELVEHVAGKWAMFKATVTIPAGSVNAETGEIVRGGGIATGYGMEDIGDFGDYAEKAETKAIGRALGALGFGTQFADDHAFGSDQGRVVDSPVEIHGGRGASGGYQGGSRGGDSEPTPRQYRYMMAVARELGIDEGGMEDRANQVFGKSLAEMTKRDVSAMIERLQAERPSGLAN